MRWPVRNQILMPMVVLMLASLAGVSGFSAILSARRAKAQIERQLQQVVTTLSEATFSLSDAMLQPMAGLSGAEFIVTSSDGEIRAASRREQEFLDLKLTQTPTTRVRLGSPIQVGQDRYFHAAVDLKSSSQPGTVHILYPEASYVAARRDAILPPLLLGSLALVLTVVASLIIASRVTRPLAQLRQSAEQIGRGEFQQAMVPTRDDEIADLTRSMNRMAELLAEYEREIREGERLNTLGQLGSAMAHEIRNAVTGCRLSLQLFISNNPPEGESPELQIATRQLTRIDGYLKRFLSLGRIEDQPKTEVRMEPIVDRVVDLARPRSTHLHVDLRWDPPQTSLSLTANADALEQMLENLVVNAIEAASHAASQNQGNGAFVKVELCPHQDGVRLCVMDNGAGPPEDVADKVFDPFVTNKPDGTGLGLAIAREVVEAHHGRISWQRRDALTHFEVWLPANLAEQE